jgi:hypothetical protein
LSIIFLSSGKGSALYIPFGKCIFLDLIPCPLLLPEKGEQKTTRSIFPSSFRRGKAKGQGEVY